MTILVLTRPNDGTADSVLAELQRRGATAVRGDVGDFPLDVTMVASLAEHRSVRSTSPSHPKVNGYSWR